MNDLLHGVPPDALAALADFFDPSDLEWKPGAATRDKKKGLAMCYITARAIQQRLDDVCGPHNWSNQYTEGPSGGVLCGISILVLRGEASGWITKWDGAENSQVEAVKGGLSDSTKRAAVQWGIGRYLYAVPSQWVPLDDRGRFARRPEIPPAYMPRRDDGGVQRDDRGVAGGGAKRAREERGFHAAGVEWCGDRWDQVRPWMVAAYAKSRDLPLSDKRSSSELPIDNLGELTFMIRERIKKGTVPPTAEEMEAADV